MRKRFFKKIEIYILRLTYHHRIPLTDYEIAKGVGISYVTAKKYVDALLKRGFLMETPNKKRVRKVSFAFAILYKYRNKKRFLKKEK